MGINWTEELKSDLVKLYEDGLSSSQIAAALRCDVTRNAVIGKINRMGLTRSTGYENKAPYKRPPRAYKPRPKPVKLFTVRNIFNPEEAAMLRCVEIIPLHKSLADLALNDCRWPYGDGPFTHCGHPQHEGSSYCGSHFYLSIGPGTASEKAATKITSRHLEAHA
jgi:GcrA cell cycle regulator